MNEIKSSWYVFVVVLGLVGCNAGAPSAVGVSKAPIFPGSSQHSKEEVGIGVSESFNDAYSVTVTSWTFSTSANRDDIVDFYKQRYPDASVENYAGNPDADYEEAQPTTSFLITTTDPGVDELTIEVFDGSFTIAESVRD